jgi:broad specificity phosphatase PhoE
MPYCIWLILILTMAQRASVQVLAMSSKRVSIVRHGQAMHNPRAEVARANGCSTDEFLALMREDDVLDAPLTDLGNDQAKSVHLPATSDINLVVSSPLSRALRTADNVYSPSNGANRVCCEHFREVNGDLLNAKRRSKSDLEKRFASWNFEDLTSEEDSLWTPNMEAFSDCAERGYLGLCWLMDRPEDSILLVAHGGILSFMMTMHPQISLQDKRSNPAKPVESRFDNCEVRHYLLTWTDAEDASNQDTAQSMGEAHGERRNILMTEVDP